MESPLKYFAELADPRVERTREHILQEILFSKRQSNPSSMC